MGALFLHLKPDEYLKKLYKTKKLVEKTSFSLQAEPYSVWLFLHVNMAKAQIHFWAFVSKLIDSYS
ncbi:hypothetical protein CJZ71_01080 [Bacillus subtilis]|nr:hypothetical protein A4A60_11125 [Bacillus subtilis]ARW31798.1 hypothetical protein S101441_02250 [Bacillus subtilis subsp. subtilis]ASV00884.1 hypothetical protein CJZ71_01080 [Bacillus subtilis]AYK70893.1 hypothetical protein D9C09_14735 [Bacillus subtilis subsp. subtilis]AYK74581.1 hypothetical protein D9C12_12530 [Bacillus subtilis subsp. subtilis]